MPNLNTQLSGQIGENIVVAELGRQKIIATSFAGNVPDIDILAYANGKSVPLQVKAQKSGNPGVNATKYLDIEFNDDVQTIRGKIKDINRDLIFVMVKVGKKYGDDEFFVFTQGIVQDLVNEEYQKMLMRHNGVRPRSPQSTHCSYYLRDLIQYKDNWKLIKVALGIK
jgi:hypothetical protein